MTLKQFMICCLFFLLCVSCLPSTIDEDSLTGKFYIYPLDFEYQWRWPDGDANCSRHGQINPATHAQNLGMGHVLDLADGMLDTWHFSLFYSIMNRLRHSSRRTYDPEEASLFIIPFDLFLDGYFRQNCGLARACRGTSAMDVWAHVESQPYFSRTAGADHALLWSGGQFHPWPRNGCDVLMGEKCRLCSITCVWMDARSNDNHFVSMPFPSSYHWWDGITAIPWSVDSTIERTMKVVYVGGNKTLNPENTKVRRGITEQCQAHPDCQWLQLSHSATDKDVAEFVRSYRRSVFCLCPAGDDPARKALSDIIMSGCIPVVFHPQTLFNQHPWHIGVEKAKQISVYIPGTEVRLGRVDIMNVLSKIDAATVRQKQRAIAELAPRLQYSLLPQNLLHDIKNVEVWDPPFKDAVDVMIDGMITRARRIARNESTGVPEEALLPRQWTEKYKDILY